MANNQAKPPKDKAQEEEERVEGALDHLDQLHLQANQELYANMVASANESNRELAIFKAEWNSDKTKAVFKQAADSQAANPKGITRWKFKDHPGWDKPKQQRQTEKTEGSGN
ncbi:hypothetical protein OQA88_9244 [Cercophora sp. LCS_1]